MQEEKKHNYFYKITNLINGKYYYGIHSTNNLNDGYMGSGTTLLKAIKKHGWEHFDKEIIADYPTRKEASDHEKRVVTKELIELDECYNLRTGGDNEYTHSEETKKKISDNATGRPMHPNTLKKLIEINTGKIIKPESIEQRIIARRNNGKPWVSDEQRKQISAANSNPTDETRKKMSDAQKNRKPISDETRENFRKAQLGRKHTPATKQKMSEWQVGKTVSESTKENIKTALNSDSVKEQRKLSAASRLKRNNGVWVSDETKEKIRQRYSNQRKCNIDGIFFDYMKSACLYYNICMATLRRRIKSDHETWKNWVYV